MVYALTNPSWDTVIDVKIARRIYGPYKVPPISNQNVNDGLLGFRKHGPPKLPETTNLVLTKSKNEYREINAMNTKMKLEKRIPPLKNL